MTPANNKKYVVGFCDVAETSHIDTDVFCDASKYESFVIH